MKLITQGDSATDSRKDFLKIIMKRMINSNNVNESTVKCLMKSFAYGKINPTQPKCITLKDTRLLIMHSN